MQRHFYLTLVAVLTYLVFGLSNLFGQAGHFIPPILLDSFFLAGLSLYFIFLTRLSREVLPLALLFVSFLTAALIESTLVTTASAKMVSIVTLLIAVGTRATFDIIRQSRNPLSFFEIAGTLAIVSGVVLLLIESRNETSFYSVYCYWFSGLLALIAALKKPQSPGVYFYLLWFLSAFYDGLNFFALWLLTL